MSSTNSLLPDEPSAEQLIFTENILSIMATALDQFGFKQRLVEVKKYSANIVFKRDKQYIRVNNSTYPTDYPYCYTVTLGEGTDADRLDYDWNPVAVWSLAKILGGKIDDSVYSMTTGPDFNAIIKQRIESATNDLLKYGITFLQGDLALFYQIREQLTAEREQRSKLDAINNGAIYITADELLSMLKREKKR